MEKQKPRLAVLASRFPFPVEKGDKLRLYHQLKQLAPDFDIYLFALIDEPLSDDVVREVDRYCKKVFIYHDRISSRNYRVVRHFMDLWPAQVRYFYSADIHQCFLKDFYSINADVVYCQLYRMAPYLSGIQAPKVLDVMDSFASIATLHADHSRWWYDRIFWNRENKLIKHFETEILNQFDHFTVISERDADALNFQSRENVSIVRNGIDVHYFQTYPDSKRKPAYDMAFIGNLDYKPNREGVRYLIKEILPLFRQNNHKIKILIGGKGAENLKRIYGEVPEISFHGWYDDIREAYYSSRIFVVPLFLGSGMQNKVLEALACELPVICTSHVINGMPMLEDNVNIANRPEEFLDQYLRLSEKDKGAEKQSGTLTVLKNELTWEAQGSVLKEVLNDTKRNYEWDIARYH